MSICSATPRRGARAAVVVLMTTACASPSTPQVDARLHFAPHVSAASLGRVAVPTFQIVGQVRAPDGRSVQRSHSDTMDATGAFLGPLVETSLTVLDRQFVDERIRELEQATSDRFSDETAPTFGKELGAQTLIVGQYRFDCSGRVVAGDPGDFVEPTVVHRQSVRVRGFALETGRVIFDVELSLDAESSQGRFLPRSLARAAAKRVKDRLDRAPSARPAGS